MERRGEGRGSSGAIGGCATPTEPRGRRVRLQVKCKGCVRSWAPVAAQYPDPSKHTHTRTKRPCFNAPSPRAGSWAPLTRTTVSVKPNSPPLSPNMLACMYPICQHTQPLTLCRFLGTSGRSSMSGTLRVGLGLKLTAAALTASASALQDSSSGRGQGRSSSMHGGEATLCLSILLCCVLGTASVSRECALRCSAERPPAVEAEGCCPMAVGLGSLKALPRL